MSMRSAASACQVLQVRVLPRAARTMRDGSGTKPGNTADGPGDEEWGGGGAVAWAALGARAVPSRGVPAERGERVGRVVMPRVLIGKLLVARPLRAPLPGGPARRPDHRTPMVYDIRRQNASEPARMAARLRAKHGPHAGCAPTRPA